MSFRISSSLFFIFLSFLCNAQSKTWTLQECISEAYDKNIQINQSQLSSEQSRISYHQSKGTRLPTLNGNASHNYQFGRSIDPSTNQFVLQNYRTNNFGLSSNVTLFNGLQNVRNIEQNKLALEASKYDVQTTKNDVSISVTLAYMDVLLGYELVENAKIQITASQSQLERTQKLVSSGTLPELNSYQIRSQLANDKLTLINAENDLAIAKVNLMQLMEMPVTPTFDVEKPILPNPNINDTARYNTEEIFNTALTSQPQIKSIDYRKKSSLMAVRSAEGARLPRLTLSANVFTFYSSLNYQYRTETTTISQITGYVDDLNKTPVYSVIPDRRLYQMDYPFFKQLDDKLGEQISLNLNIPIINNRLLSSNIERSKVSYKIAELNERNTKNQLRKNIEQATVDVRSAGKRFEAGQEALVASEMSYINSEKRMNAGLLTSTEFLIQKNNFAIAQSNLAQAKYDYYFKIKLLEFYKGTSLLK
ncbi:MAG TPA: TolC family protein [Cytophagaceae bacterium]|jgi:outer membrane protein